MAGWMYMNLDSANAGGNPSVSQNWVIVSMAAEGRFDFDAAALGNGCRPETDQSNPDRTCDESDTRSRYLTV